MVWVVAANCCGHHDYCAMILDKESEGVLVVVVEALQGIVVHCCGGVLDAYVAEKV